MNQAIKTVVPVKDKVKQKEKRSVNLIIDKAQAQEYLDTFAKKNAKKFEEAVDELYDVVKRQLVKIKEKEREC